MSLFWAAILLLLAGISSSVSSSSFNYEYWVVLNNGFISELCNTATLYEVKHKAKK